MLDHQGSIDNSELAHAGTLEMTLKNRKKSGSNSPAMDVEEPIANATGAVWWKSYAITAVILGIVTSFIFWQALETQYRIGNASDFPAHAERARSLLKGETNDVTHPIFQWLVIAVATIMQSDFPVACLNAGLFLYVVIGSLLLARIMWPSASAAWKMPVAKEWLLGGIAVVAIMLCNPITVFTLGKSNLYFGYSNVNVFHNPTMLALKPFALLAFWQATSLMEPLRRSMQSLILRLVFVVATVACTSLAKPSFVMIFLPSLGLFAFYLTLRLGAASKNAWIVFIACSVTGVTALLLQLMQYKTTEYGGAFAFAPFKTSLDTGGMILVKLLMSIAFPIAVVAMFPRAAIRHWRLPFAWLVFSVGWAIANLFIEDGPSLWFRNFTWCAQIGIFVLFFESIAFLREQSLVGQSLSSERETFLKSLSVCVAVLACHVTAGVAFYMLYVLGLNVEQVY
jgi:hypothetical protein